jgi:multidrug resistance efflux pump
MAEQTADAALVKLKERYATRIQRARATLAKAENRVAELHDAAESKQQDELLSGAGDLLGAFLGGRRRSNPLGQAARRRTATQTARNRAETASEALDEDRAEVEALEQELAAEIATLTEEHMAKASQIEEVEIPLEKTDIRVAELKLVWIPVS